MMKWLLVLTLSSLILVGCKNGFSKYTLEEKKAIIKKHDNEWKRQRICERRYRENPSLLLDCVSDIDDSDFERMY
ncbi:hypothetical protein [Arsenophonus sp.]|uniref:hypothetical protein n=1 Tax=Arsenophonus sp. TaxID=1872640 RepID=UPI00387A7F06